MSDLLVEVDEALKQDRMQQLWNQYGGFFIGFLAVVILGTATNAGYHHLQTTKNIKQTDIYLNNINKGAVDHQSIIELSSDLGAGLKELALLKAAGSALDKNDKAAALDIYARIESDLNANSVLKQLAFYMHTNLSDTLKTDEKLARLETIYNDIDNPWHYHARLDAALIMANKLNDYKAARTHLSFIINNNKAIQTIRQKAQSIDILYGLKEKQ